MLTPRVRSACVALDARDRFVIILHELISADGEDDGFRSVDDAREAVARAVDVDEPPVLGDRVRRAKVYVRGDRFDAGFLDLRLFDLPVPVNRVAAFRERFIKPQIAHGRRARDADGTVADVVQDQFFGFLGRFDDVGKKAAFGKMLCDGLKIDVHLPTSGFLLALIVSHFLLFWQR